MRHGKKRAAALVDRVRVPIRFSETDAMGVVWHGNYVKFFEDGRESFGRNYGLEYLRVYSLGYTIPIVDLHCSYKKSLTFGQEIIVETRYIPCEAAKIEFDYIVYEAESMEVIATGSTVQVFLNDKQELELNNPAFYEEWKKKWNID